MCAFVSSPLPLVKPVHTANQSRCIRRKRSPRLPAFGPSSIRACAASRTPDAFSASASAPSAPASAAKTATVWYTALGNNTFVLEGAGVRILVDPFLVGDLVFFSPKFYALEKSATHQGLGKAGDYDAIMLTQTLPDHAHEPTLRAIVKTRPDVPIIAPGGAGPLLTNIGFTNFTLMSLGTSTQPLPQAKNVRITVGPGSVVGPPGSTPMLAVLFDFDGLRVYHEPHGEHDAPFLSKCSRLGTVHAVVVPVVSTKLQPINYALVNGADEALELARAIKAKTIVALDNAAGKSQGILAKFLEMRNDRQKVQDTLRNDPVLSDVLYIEPPQDGTPVVIAKA